MDSDASSASGEDTDTEGEPTGGAPEDGPELSECRQPTYAVYAALHRSCAGCHGEGSNSPAFADFESFERLIAYNPEFVIPGEPIRSPLLALLQGEAAPPLNQMPPGAMSFAELDGEGETDISLAELKGWINDLQPCDIPAAGLSPQYARRVTAEQIQASLTAQLDLTPEEVMASAFPVDDPVFGVLDGNLRGAWSRWAGLGGPDYLKGNLRTGGWSPLFLQSLGPMAQAWCAGSITAGYDALFPAADADATDEASVRANIRTLYLNMLGIVAEEQQVDEMYRDVYLHYASRETHALAMKAVCAAFVRHPLWLTY